MEPDYEGFLYPQVDKEKCVRCHLCETVCPVCNKDSREKTVEAYAAYTKNADTLHNSSSGGIFSEIAEYILKQNGVVFGASFSEDFTVKHTLIESIDNLEILRGSKYLQSDMNSCYVQAKQMLDAGRLVLFSGTPCQVEGLIMFLKRDYSNLITQDVICHGVPSPLVWKKYIAWLETSMNSRIVYANFRDKKDGWSDFGLRIGFSNGMEYRKRLTEDIFMQGFLENIYLRPSCYCCHFKTMHRASDFTLGDFWGVRHVCPQMEHSDGTSLVWLNTEKAKKIWTELENKVICEKVDLLKSIKYNIAAVESVSIPKKREQFFTLMESSTIHKAVRDALPQVSATKKIARKAKIIINKICHRN